VLYRKKTFANVNTYKTNYLQKSPANPEHAEQKLKVLDVLNRN
jgi:hypothetical protein